MAEFKNKWRSLNGDPKRATYDGTLTSDIIYGCPLITWAGRAGFQAFPQNLSARPAWDAFLAPLSAGGMGFPAFGALG